MVRSHCKGNCALRSFAALALSLLAGQASAETTCVVELHPISSLVMAGNNAAYGKIGLECDAFGAKGLYLAVSGLHFRHNELENDFFGGGDDTVNMEYSQASLFLGKRVELGPLYSRPVVQLGYARRTNRQEPSSDFDGSFAAGLVYLGMDRAVGRVVWGFDLGAGMLFYGREVLWHGAPSLVLDVDATVGFRF